jgi:hypothetical protein
MLSGGDELEEVGRLGLLFPHLPSLHHSCPIVKHMISAMFDGSGDWNDMLIWK